MKTVEVIFQNESKAVVRAKLTADSTPGYVTFDDPAGIISKKGREILTSVIGEHFEYAARRIAKEINASVSITSSGELKMLVQ